MKYTVGPRGTRKTFGIPGTGLSYTTTSGWGNKQSSPSTVPKAPQSLDLGFFRSIFTPTEERDLVEGLKEYLLGATNQAYSTFCKNSGSVDSVFMSGFLALGKDLFPEAQSKFLSCRTSTAELGKAIQKYLNGFHLSLQITDYIDAPINVDQRGVSLALAESYQRQGKYAEAIAEVTVLWNTNQSDTVVCLSLCDLVVANPAATRTDIEDIIQMTASVANDDPIHANILYLRGAAMFRLKLADAAIQQMSALLRKKAGRPDLMRHQIRYLRGRSYEQRNLNAEAKKDYELIYAEDPGYKDVQSRLRVLGP